MLTQGVLVLALVVTGAASRYDPGVFERVERNRRLPEWDGAHLAVLDCGMVGEKLMLCHAGRCMWARVTDCAGIADGGAEWMINGGYAAELDYETTLELDCLGKEIKLYEPRFGHSAF